ncbi:MAG: YqiA/YcfP family alpha/beta fold hydrolase [Sulfurimonas sp.]|uniref:YqiA/YcfP family alpha/beta fold hydrolase n=1 Tax=Sulfurimonas sp. TaxID=2022749 RepID=UPI0028CEB7B6|nr:YqiA/YcfP family alpha/beta fold hydrolase [Sulfurimonas sp.]MDT8338344.1 YqiA/YcfP family alpha/beta fold hydrolase [Sulfurimonas sp.]
MTIYIHGFGGSGCGVKAELFRIYFKSINQPFIAPSLSYVPHLVIKTLEEIVESDGGNVNLIGSSLGGFYAIYLAQKYGLKAVLINPSINPDETLKKVLGMAPNFYDNSSFEWRESHLEMLKEYRVEAKKRDNFFVLLQKGDELLDYREAVNSLPYAKFAIEEGGSHSFENIEKYFDDIKWYLIGCGNRI